MAAALSSHNSIYYASRWCPVSARSSRSDSNRVQSTCLHFNVRRNLNGNFPVSLEVRQLQNLSSSNIIHRGNVSPSSIRADVNTAEDAPSEVRKIRPGEKKGFIEEMRIRAMKLHTKDQAKEGEKETQTPLAKWEPTIKGYIQFLVDSKLVYDTMEEIVNKATHPLYAEFQNTGLERSNALQKDLDWFKSLGNPIPSPDSYGSEYSQYLKNISETDPPSFICHFYNVYFAHSAGGKMIGKKLSEMILDGKVLEFYQWEGDLPELLGNVKEKINKISQDWSREDKDRCLTETELSFKYSGSILRLLMQ